MYSNDNVPSLTQLHFIFLFIQTLLNALEARIDIQVTASTDPDADYAAEVVDARVDTWGEAHNSAGNNIRNGQLRLGLSVQTVNDNQAQLQKEVDDETLARTEMIVACGEISERRKEEILTEEANRLDEDDSLQKQIDDLSSAILQINLQLVDIYERLRN